MASHHKIVILYKMRIFIYVGVNCLVIRGQLEKHLIKNKVIGSDNGA